MPEQWSCGHCPLVVGLPDEVADPEGYADTLMLIREHRFTHIASTLIFKGLLGADDEALVGMSEDKPSGWAYPENKYQPVTTGDVAPALAEADRIVRGVR